MNLSNQNKPTKEEHKMTSTTLSNNDITDFFMMYVITFKRFQSGRSRDFTQRDFNNFASIAYDTETVMSDEAFATCFDREVVMTFEEFSNIVG